ncbi:MAG: type I restriction endonuclease subunit R [Planctomycetota bacterium]
MSDLGGERQAVQDRLIGYACEESAEYETGNGRRLLFRLGWEYVSPEEALRLRGGETGLVFRELFTEQMQKLNPGFMDHLLAEDLIRRLERVPPTIEGNLRAWEHLKGLRTVFVPNEKRERNVRFIGADDIDRNTFHVTDEFSFSNGTHTNRADVVFLINGVPVFLVETKASHKRDGIAGALDQLRRYGRETPEMMALLQVYALTHIVRFYYGATWGYSRKGLFNWKEEAEGDFEALVKSFLDRERVVRVLSDYILFTRQDDELKKVVLRPHQMRGVQKVVDRAASTEKARGLVWHTQGSGKTYTMIVAAQKIIENPAFENPTVIMLVDRNELETQLFGNLAAVGIEEVEVARSKRHLRQLLERDRRGLIVTLIHKFDGMPADICTRRNVIVLVDEAHRTTGGKLGNYLMGALPNATYIGFTGTPIDKTAYGQGTFITFGVDDPPKGYLDKYSIAESIEDGTTVKLHYTLAPNDLQVDRETLESEFLDLAELMGVSDVDELNRVLEKAVTLRNMLKNPERVERVAEYVAQHFMENVEPLGYKAFLVGVDREACALYKDQLDRHLPPEYSAVVYSAAHNDPEELARYHLSKSEEKQIRKDFRHPEKLPKILIVTEKLLTGFDAPVLYCMYLDKPMRDHVLLQAIARVNRPYEDETGRKKPAGFVLDFVGIFGNLEKALAFDSADIEGVVDDIDVLKGEFACLMKEARRSYLPLVEGKAPDKAVEAVLETFRDEEERQDFYGFFRHVSDIYEIISPDAFLRPYLTDYETLARMYRILREAYEPGVAVDRGFARKTAKLVQEQAQGGAVKPALQVYEINEETLRKIEESQASDTEKVFNLLKSIFEAVQSNLGEEPYLLSIGERAERLAELYRSRQRSTEETLNSLKGLVEQIKAARAERSQMGMPRETFTIYWLLKGTEVRQPVTLAEQVSSVLGTYTHWRTSEQHEREVKQELYRQLIGQGVSDARELKDLCNRILDALRAESSAAAR